MEKIQQVEAARDSTIRDTFGVDHSRLTYKYQARDIRLTEVHGNVVHNILG